MYCITQSYVVMCTCIHILAVATTACCNNPACSVWLKLQASVCFLFAWVSELGPVCFRVSFFVYCVYYLSVIVFDCHSVACKDSSPK